MSPLQTNSGTPLPLQLREISQAAVARAAADITEDEKSWARDTFEVLLFSFEPRALAGDREALVDLADSDLVVAGTAPDDPPLLRGGAAALRGLFETSGFGVTVRERYAGHPRGRYALVVSW